jgi:hypothetical protein
MRQARVHFLRSNGSPPIHKHAVRAGIAAPIGNHTFRPTGITNFLENGGTLKYWQDAAREARNRQHRITCGPAGPDRDVLAGAYRSEHQFAGAQLGSIVRQRR